MRNEIINLRDYKRIAIMGGTFDPIHYGHLVTAEAVRSMYDVERVIFIPTGSPPHKSTPPDVSHSEHRYLMTVLATYNNPFFDISRIEIDRPGITYTIDTIAQIREICNDQIKIYFITGADAVSEIINWKDSEQLLKMCSFIAVTRPGYNKDKLRGQVNSIKLDYQSRLHYLEVPELDISSSDIRERVRTGKPIKYMLPLEVEDYIAKNALYKGDRPLEL